jgi:hypothetical protein
VDTVWSLRPQRERRGNVPLRVAVPPADSGEPLGEVVCEESLGGLLKHYRRAA